VISFKIADKEGITNNLNIAKAVERVLGYNTRHPQNKISIINISYGLAEDDAYLKASLKKAYDAGITIIASAGNSGNSVIAYPAAYDFVVAVAAVNPKKDFVNTSSRGPAVDFVAPGAALFAPDNMQGYGWVRGTSFSTAFITGTAALVSEAYKNKYGVIPTPAQLTALLAKISTPLPEISKESQGYGAPDASKILSLI
jgi:subtilisin family serine protease